MIIMKALTRALLFCIAISLSACSTQTSSTASPTERGILAGAALGALVGGAATMQAGAPLGAAIGGLAGGLLANLTAQQKTLLQLLQADKVTVIEAGEQVTLVIPAQQLFLPSSPAFNTKSYLILNDIALFLRGYSKVDVSIVGYTDNLGSSRRNMALSRQRAQASANYLWSQGVDTRLLYTEGRGSNNPIADNAYAKGRQANSRIEISFQRIPEQ
jgi:outer membrane protein OmpA-like peptidoglycan-associated protein